MVQARHGTTVASRPHGQITLHHAGDRPLNIITFRPTRPAGVERFGAFAGNPQLILHNPQAAGKLLHVKPQLRHYCCPVLQQPLLAHRPLGANTICPGAHPDGFPGRRAKEALSLMANTGDGSLGGVMLIAWVLRRQDVFR